MIKKIENVLGSKYYNNLLEIEKAVTKIWDPSFIIIKYYTNHGIEHSERLISHIFRIIENKNLNLKEEEYFILFASAYLHDIGMQCDLNKHKYFKDFLENKYDVTEKFKNNSLSYTQDEMNILRKYHNKLSYEIIVKSNIENIFSDLLSTAIQNINNARLVEDIADICLYHSKEKINDIEEKFKFNQNNTNKRMIASLFRLSDELDIDSKRVDDTDIELFSINKESEFIWWLHSRLNISFDELDNIVLSLDLNKDEDRNNSKQLENILRKNFIDKNKEVLDILYLCKVNISLRPIQIMYLNTMPKIPKKYYEFFNNDSDKKQTTDELSINTTNILPSVYNNCKRIKLNDDETVFYELWETKLESINYYLILGKERVKDLLQQFIIDINTQKNEKYKTSIKNIIIITPKVSVAYTKRTLQKIRFPLDFNIHMLFDFVWDNVINKDLNKISIGKSDDYIEQNLFTHNFNSENIEENLGNACDYLYEMCVNENDQHLQPILLQADGGTGKSYLLKELFNKINSKSEDTKKIAFLISSETIIEKLYKVNTGDTINSIQKLVRIYADIMWDTTLTEKSITQSMTTGNFIVLIDGIDEFLSIYNENFMVKEFLQSIIDINNDLKTLKIIISSRFGLLSKNLSNHYVFKNYILKGFNYQSLKKYVKKRIGTNKEEISKKIASFFEGEEYYMPFFIKTIIDDYQKNNNLYLLSDNQGKNDLVYFIINREITRQSLDANIDTVMQIFYEIAILLDYNNKIDEEEVKLSIEATIGDNIEFNKKFMINPLFKHQDNNITFKFSFLKNYFLSKYSISYLISFSNLKQPLNDDFINIISQYYTGKGEVFQQLVTYFDNDTKLKDYIKSIFKCLNHSINDEKYNKFKSALLYLLLTTNSNKKSTENDNIELIKYIYGNSNQIESLSIYGGFFPLDFSNQTIKNSYFSEYSHFFDSNFNANTQFKSCVFINNKLNLENEKIENNLTHSLFDKECKISKKLINICEINQKKTYNKIISFIKNFNKLINKLISHRTVHSDKLFSILKSKEFNNKNILKQMIQMNILQINLIAQNNYSISDNYAKSFKNINRNYSSYDTTVVEIIKELNKNILDINYIDTDSFFKDNQHESY